MLLRKYAIFKFIAKMGRYKREIVPQTTSFKFNRSLSRRAMFIFKMNILSGAGVMYVQHIILDEVIGKYG